MDWLGRAVFETFPGFLDGSFFLSGELGGALTAMDTKIYERRFTSDELRATQCSRNTQENSTMVKPHRKLKKANHGQRAANSKARKAKRRKVRT